MGLGQIKWSTTRFNGALEHWGWRGRRLWLPWFAVGAVLGGLLQLAAVGLLLGNLFACLVELLARGEVTGELALAHPVTAGDGAAPSRQVLLLLPVVPGLNVPAGHFVYYFAAVLGAALVHEWGHAMAAGALRCRVRETGLFVFLLLPGAWVDVDPVDLSALRPLQQLSVFTAGAFHNVVLTAVTASLASVAATETPSDHPASSAPPRLPARILAPPSAPWLQQVGQLMADWPLAPFHVIQLNNCTEGWLACLSRPNHGRCVEARELTGRAVRPDALPPARLQCFRAADDAAPAPARVTADRFCLPSRLYVGAEPCTEHTDCAAGARHRCLVPVFGPGDDSSVPHATAAMDQMKLFEMTVGGDVDQQPRQTVVLQGTARQLLHDLPVAGGPSESAAPASPLALLLSYTAMLSGGLALINMAPVYSLDGHWALESLVRAAGVKPASGAPADLGMLAGPPLPFLVGWIVKGTTLLLLANIVLSLWVVATGF